MKIPRFTPLLILLSLASCQNSTSEKEKELLERENEILKKELELKANENPRKKQTKNSNYSPELENSNVTPYEYSNFKYSDSEIPQIPITEFANYLVGRDFTYKGVLGNNILTIETIDQITKIVGGTAYSSGGQTYYPVFVSAMKDNSKSIKLELEFVYINSENGFIFNDIIKRSAKRID